MVLLAFRLCSSLAVAAAFFAGGSSLFASAVDLTAYSFEDLASLPTGNLTEDSFLTIKASVYACDEVTTVKAHGPHMLTVFGEFDLVLTNVRFEISGGADFYLKIVMGTLSAFIMFTGVTELASDGGVFNVEHGSSAAIEVFPTFEHNSVQAGYSGGAVYAGGKVYFPYATIFNENSVMSDESSPSGSGGAVFVDHGGAVMFGSTSGFMYNEVGSGGRGGAVANFGSLPTPAVTQVETPPFSMCVRPSILVTSSSVVSGGGASHGGHIYTSGVVYAEDACELTYGSAAGDGGAVYIDEQGSFT
eukprot:jgi/Undpi1/12847/HiC_scaffold_7.g02514.m1